MKITEKDSKPPFPGTRRGERQEPEPDGRATHVLPRDADLKVFTVCRLHSPALENRCLPAYGRCKIQDCLFLARVSGVGVSKAFSR